MKLSDIMGEMGLAIYAEVALLLFFVVFLSIVAWVYSRRNRGRWEQASRLPLEDGGESRVRVSGAPAGGRKG